MRVFFGEKFLSKFYTGCSLKWIRNFARKNYEKPVPSGSVNIEVDEMWHFLHVKKTNFGSGKPYPEKQVSSSTGNVGTEMLPLSKD